MIILYIAADDSIGIIYPVDKTTIEQTTGLLTEQQYIDIVVASVPIDAQSYQILQSADNLQLREYRAAWVDIEGELLLDHEIVRQILLNNRNAAIEDTKQALLYDITTSLAVGDSAGASKGYQRLSILTDNSNNLDSTGTKDYVQDPSARYDPSTLAYLEGFIAIPDVYTIIP